MEKQFDLQIIDSDRIEYGDLVSLENFKFENFKGFPVSYKNFVKQLGYGLTAQMFLIYIPMGDYCDSIFVRSLISQESKHYYINELLENYIWSDFEPNVSLDLAKALYPFGKSENGDYLFWDINSGENGEFDIYIADFRGVSFQKIASNLYELIDIFTSEKASQLVPMWHEILPKTFQPHTKFIEN